MDRDIPNYNPLVNNKIQTKNMQLHYQRLNNIKVPFIAIHSPLITLELHFRPTIKPIAKLTSNYNNARPK